MGAHQLDNAAAAVTAALALARDGFERITDAAIVEGLYCATLPGRFQVSPNSTHNSTLSLMLSRHRNVSACSLGSLRI